MIVGVTGYAQHGKDTVGRILVNHLGYKRAAFADALKEMAYRLNPLVESFGVEPVRLQWLVNELDWEGAKLNPEVRRLLQVLGTECVRDIVGDDSWVRALAHELVDGENYVITDVRFPNEAEFIHGWNGLLLRVVRPNFDNGVDTTHPSEANIAGLNVDFTIVNDSDIDTLTRRVTAVLMAARS